MNRLLYILLIIALFKTLCYTQDKEVCAYLSKNAEMVKVAENLYMDKYEISNAKYRKYIDWLKTHAQFDAYQKALPDTQVWRKGLGFNEPYVEYYFRHPSYDEYPVVAVSYDQVKDYCQWRTDRLKETLFPDGIPDQYEIVFRIPTETEWENAARAGNENSTFPWEGARILDKDGKNLANYDDGSPMLRIKPEDIAITNQPEYFKSNALGLYNMAGNVAEFTIANKEPLCIHLKGGSWMQAGFYCMINLYSSYKEPNEYTGFRCVCELRKINE